ncbi:MAG: hypothetical protein WCK03_00305 [Candidatus Taylorbacteria bacterium]
MPHNKQLRSNKKPKTLIKDTSEDADDIAAPVSKINKVIDIYIQDDVVGVVEEKPETDPLTTNEESDESASEESGLDDEEINPFGDKWEV